MSSSERPSGRLAAWIPAAWPAEPEADADDFAGADRFVASGDFAPALATRPVAAPAPAAFAAQLPDFGAPDFGAPDLGAPPPRGAGGDDVLGQACARAADAREAELRIAFEARWTAEADALAERAAADADAAYAAGLAEGRAAGEADARAALAGAADALDAAAAEVRSHEGRWLADLDAHVAALAVAVAHHVIGRAVAGDDALVVALVARAVAEFPADQPLAARVHPLDVAALKAAWAAAPRAAELRWVPDAGLARGGALVEGRERIVDGRVDMALERVYRAISGQQA